MYFGVVKSFKIFFGVSTIVMLFLTGCHHEDDIHVTFIGNSCIERWDLNRFFPTLITTNLGLSNSGVENLEHYSGMLGGQQVVILTGGTEFTGLVRSIQEDSLSIYIDYYIARYVNAIAALRADRIYVLSNLPQGLAHNNDASNHNVHIKYFNTMIRDNISKRGWKWVDVYPLMLDGDVLNPAYSDDGLHPNDIGYEIITQQLMKEF